MSTWPPYNDFSLDGTLHPSSAQTSLIPTSEHSPMGATMGTTTSESPPMGATMEESYFLRTKQCKKKWILIQFDTS